MNSATAKQFGLEAGPSLVGIAAADDFVSAPEGFWPSDVLEGSRSVIVLAAEHPKEAMGDTITYTETRNEMVKHMTTMAQEVAKRVKKQRCKAKAVSAVGGKMANGNLYGDISLKHAAELGGLGVITRNYLLTNERYGNRLWLSAVVTDAALAPDEKAQYSFCDNCNMCAEACPGGALDAYPPTLGKQECGRTYKMVDGKLEFTCFLCRTVCPAGMGEAR